jgi:hypothetical protein
MKCRERKELKSIEEEIKERIVLGTKAYYGNLKFLRAD